MRYTDLSFEQIVSELENPDIKSWQSFLATEMGNILAEGGPEGQKAEAFLRDHWLKSKNPIYRLIAYRYLDALECLEAKTFDKLNEFEKDPANAELIKKAREPNQGGEANLKWII
jgi:hypothetical protein